MMGWSPEEQREHRKLWVEALRSGKYEQADNYLQTGAGFCCLGVACDISGLADWHESGVDNIRDVSFFSAVTAKGSQTQDLPSEVQEWLGLRTFHGDFASGSLVVLNDNGESFAAIADIIESEPEGLIATSEAA